MIRHLALLLAISACRLMAADPYQGWPEGWRTAYDRFEKFIQAKEANFPKSNLAVLPDGGLTHGVRFREGTTEHLYYRVFGSDQGATLRYPNLQKDPLTGTYAIALQVTTEVSSSQHLYPLLWVEVSYQDGKKKVKAIAKPEEAERRWPSERLMKFIDFHAFRSGNSIEFQRTNEVVEPNLELGLTPDGILVRDRIDPELEKLLRWRVYHNGELIEDKSATGELRCDVNRGVGEYHAVLVVEGPTGFLPVSNYLYYPLFAIGEERAALLPPMDALGFPKFFSSLFSPEQLAKMATSTEKYKRGTGYHIGAVYHLPEVDPDSPHRNLHEFWKRWAWKIWRFKSDPKSESWRVPLKE